ncbi:glutamyl-tRNA synthetase [Candidatus Koribacter versatilis Ellin345]|uniref:Glutamate--tRNA ligase 2 n=1 Tax=Koribacter versatilis (strain Ellin345) TaxID=204669 RepID=SYE2_KORVE|nr:glutamate--tRNA ligase [Candidatus Koribacter versatilis]Q1IVB1.1 RecName: Full=Glutamate--tRNA ligase 2; AltName: Full=Glutamyl-tRNA synthetase 2; Short=GluRS 2 [Candidatus Koribacter versatilis Ellin345]ABF39189.1 glutamyl-tRNA synthetase [Candidatus Koribacter versatilis Ellin345]
MSSQVSSPVRVRFAPSPTGYLHVGGARTALFNWLYARHVGGTLVLRIEDTDLERSTPEMVEGILVGMRWLGLNWDEGPYYQTQRMDLYKAAAEKLVASGHAYYCFCSKEGLEQRRKAATAAGRAPQYDESCRKIGREDAAARKQGGAPCAVRFAVPETGNTKFQDAVFGEVEFANPELEDFVLLRSDGVPTYHLSVVVDDVDMKISHILRGADHISNTPKQVLLYQAMGATLPIFAHVPLILGPDKTRLSKRHGATSVISYSDEGIVPEAFRNFLALLGWTAPEGSPEKLGDEELIKLFSLEGISHSNAVFDRPKLDWFNTEYIRAYPAEKLLPLIQKEWQKVGLTPANPDAQHLVATIELLKPRARNLKDFAGSFKAFFTDDYANDPEAVEKFLKDPAVREMLVELGERYANAGEFTEQSTEQVLRDLAAEKGVKAGGLINGARVALTGQAVAPSLFAVMVNLGREKTVSRLRRAKEIQ